MHADSRIFSAIEDAIDDSMDHFNQSIRNENQMQAIIRNHANESSSNNKEMPPNYISFQQVT